MGRRGGYYTHGKKRCPICGYYKDRDTEFYKNRARGDNRGSACISCDKEQKTKYYQENKEAIKKRVADRYHAMRAGEYESGGSRKITEDKPPKVGDWVISPTGVEYVVIRFSGLYPVEGTNRFMGWFYVAKSRLKEDEKTTRKIDFSEWDKWAYAPKKGTDESPTADES